MNKRNLDLIGLGECMLELRADCALGQAPAFTRSFGGDVLNALVSFSRLGGTTGFITRVGNDPFGAALLASWEAEGIDLRCAPLVEGENGVYFISLLAAGEREFTYRRLYSAASYLSVDDLDEAFIASASCLLVSGITQAISATAQLATLRACQIARRNGVTVAYDPNYRARLWERRGGLSSARAALAELLPWMDIILPSFPSDAVLLDDEPDGEAQAALRFAALGPEVAQKCGAKGAGVVANHRWRAVPATKALRVIDTTGAGDAWNGAYLLMRIKEKAAPETAALVANAVAADKLAHRGAIPPYTQQSFC